MGDKSTSCCWFPMRLPKAHPCLIGTAWLQETGVNISGVPELKLGTPALQSVWKGSGTSPCSPHRYNVGQRAVGCQQHPQGHHDMHRALAGTLPPLAHREIPHLGTGATLLYSLLFTLHQADLNINSENIDVKLLSAAILDIASEVL